VAALGPPRKILYKEDLIRAQFYKVFFPQEGADSEEVERVREVFNLVSNSQIQYKKLDFYCDNKM
jgi:hypothetical protein